MIDGHSLVLFMAAGLALNLTPGPDMLYVAARSASEGRAAGVVSALGIGLVWLGARAFASRGGVKDARPEPAPLGAIFRQGVITNVLNPKVALFFLAFLPQFTDAARGNVALQVIALGLLFDTSGTIVNLAVALGSNGAAARLREGSRAGAILQKATGGLFIAHGIRLGWVSAG